MRRESALSFGRVPRVATAGLDARAAGSPAGLPRRYFPLTRACRRARSWSPVAAALRSCACAACRAACRACVPVAVAACAGRLRRLRGRAWARGRGRAVVVVRVYCLTSSPGGAGSRRVFFVVVVLCWLMCGFPPPPLTLKTAFCGFADVGRVCASYSPRVGCLACLYAVASVASMRASAHVRGLSVMRAIDLTTSTRSTMGA